MGIVRDILLGRPNPAVSVATAPVPTPPEEGGRVRFQTDIDSGILYGAAPWDSTPVARVSRREALTVPAVKRVRDLVATSIGGLPVRLVRPDRAVQDWSLFTQPEENVPTSVTWTRVAEDLLFDSIAWLRITQTGWHGKPVSVVRLDPSTVTVQPDWRVYVSGTGRGNALTYVPDAQLIRIDSPNAPLLTAGARAIRTCIALATATDNAAGGLPPMTYFTPAEGADPADDDEIVDLLDAWQTARAARATGYVPASLKLNALGWNPDQLQLTALRDQAVLEIARLGGVDPEELGVSTTSRTYFNAFDRKQNFIQFTLNGYLRAIADRLSMDDVTPRGFTAAHDTDAFFQADTLARYQAYLAGLQSGAITHDEIRNAESKPILSDAERAAIPSAPATAPTTGVPSHA